MTGLVASVEGAARRFLSRGLSVWLRLSLALLIGLQPIVTAATQADTAITSAAHDGLGNPLTAVDREGQATTRTFDAVTVPSGVTASYAHDQASELMGVTYAQRASTLGSLTYGWDGAGRIATRGGTLFQSILPGASTATYDIANRMTARTAGGVTITPTWDAIVEDTLHHGAPSGLKRAYAVRSR